MGTPFRRSVTSFADTNHIPVVRFHKGDRKIDIMGRYLTAQAATSRSGVAAIGVAQEYQNVFAATQRVRGHEKVPTGGQEKIPAGGHVRVPTHCVSIRGPGLLLLAGRRGAGPQDSSGDRAPGDDRGGFLN